MIASNRLTVLYVLYIWKQTENAPISQCCVVSNQLTRINCVQQTLVSVHVVNPKQRHLLSLNDEIVHIWLCDGLCVSMFLDVRLRMQVRVRFVSSGRLKMCRCDVKWSILSIALEMYQMIANSLFTSFDACVFFPAS